MARIKANELKKYVWSLNPNEHFYINAIGCTKKAVDALREMIIDGTIQLDEFELRKNIVPSAWGRFLSGEYIIPQMDYVKRKDPKIYKKNFLITFDDFKNIEFEINAGDGEQAMLKALEIAKYYGCSESVMHINLIRH